MVMRKYFILFALVAFGAIHSFAQQIVDIHQEGDKIKIEYDLREAADFVRLYVSTDGGVIYRGPLKFVEGDVEKVAAGYNRIITWDVLKEFKTFESDNVKFKLSIKMKEKWYNETFVTLGAAYSTSPQLSFGFTIGQVKHFGWFFSFMTNGGFKGFGKMTECDADGHVGGHLPMYIDKTATDRFSITAGLMMRLKGPLCLKVGAGYGARHLCWQDVDGNWYRNKEYSCQGVDVTAGLQANLGAFVVSLEAVTTNFKTIEGKLGLGFAIRQK